MWNVRLTTASKAARGRGVDSSAPKVSPLKKKKKKKKGRISRIKGKKEGYK